MCVAINTSNRRYAAAEIGRLNMVKYLLEEAGSHVNASDDVSVSNCQK